MKHIHFDVESDGFFLFTKELINLLFLSHVISFTVEESVATISPVFPTISDLSYVSILSIFSFQKNIPNPRAIATTTIAIITYCILSPLP